MDSVEAGVDVEAGLEVLGTTEVAEGTGEEEVEGTKDVAGSGKDVAVTLKDGWDTEKDMVGMEEVVGADEETLDVAATIKAQI